MDADIRAAWAARRYLAQDGAGPRAEALVDRAETALAAAGKPAIIRDVWMLLAQRTGSGDDADIRAAAAWQWACVLSRQALPSPGNQNRLLSCLTAWRYDKILCRIAVPESLLYGSRL